MASRAIVIKAQLSVPVGYTRYNSAYGGVFRLGVEHLAAAIVTIGSHLVPAVGLTAGLVDRQRGLLERIMRTAHAAARRRYSAFLDSHGSNPLGQKNYQQRLGSFPSGQRRQRFIGACRRRHLYLLLRRTRIERIDR